MKLLSLLVVLGVSIFSASCGSETTASDDIVARVNGNEITAAELEKQFPPDAIFSGGKWIKTDKSIVAK